MRTDLAAPSIIDPAAFTFVAGCYFGNPGEEFDAMLVDWMAEKDVTGNNNWFSKRADVRKQFNLAPEGNFTLKGTCDHCGAHFVWGSVYAHASGLHIVVGNVCADKTLSVPSRAVLDANRLRSRIAAAKEAARNAAAARAAAAADGYDWLYDSRPHANKILEDIAGKGLQYGGLTARQAELVKRIHSGTKAEWEVARDAREAERAAARAASNHVGTVGARLVMTVTVEVIIDITPAVQPYGYGSRYLYLCRDAAGNRIVYKGAGSAMPAKGETAVIKATVSEHGDYKGEKQTFVKRPVNMAPVTAPTATA